MLIYRHFNSTSRHPFRRLRSPRPATPAPGAAGAGWPRTISPALLRLAAAARLLRPAQALTALADGLAGLAIAWGLAAETIHRGFWQLPLAAFLLYCGGAVLNDLCDAERDGRQRPHRLLPRGQVSWPWALALCALCLAGGLLLAMAYGTSAGVVAAALVGLIALYNGHAQHHPWPGSLCLGLCHGGSLLLGLAASPQALGRAWPLAAIPLLYFGTVTRLGRWGRTAFRLGWLLALAAPALAVSVYGVLAASRGQWPAYAFLGAFAALAWPDLQRACRRPSPAAGREAMAGALYSLVVFDAAVAAVFAGPLTAAAILLLLPAARWLGRLFPLG